MKEDAQEWAIFAEKMVRLAGEKIIELRNESRVEITMKNAGELVTSADLASDHIIRDAIVSTYPEHGILSEETTEGVLAKDRFKGPLWIIDPLDGTVNYSRNLPHFAISAAIAVDGVVWAGAVHAPDLGVTYVGVRGGGAFCNGEQLQVQPVNTLSESVVGTGFPHDKSKVHLALERVNLLATHCRDIRRLAAPAIDICYVASGRLDAHTESLAPWDVAAAGLIAREAGAITGHIGEVSAEIPVELYGEGVVIASPGIVEELLSLLRNDL
ncbi:myo-inositol-1(or 4)-monophosphatase [Paenibacillus uliginis N3/975]|uniref:Inositol-1-monophosphatase n=1 Tax=Paenibacillus uliginis N3/975 TaxID=1313296 RepID=A0A1X7HUS7_9BACL|nr:inositol monophosphatase family protein [Paenibacillus uliginis]SMF92471.1 myo-inositol-1(or 4)-monophosphatase [Paenibacillus uliginis N3/975]